jgi:uncharacterized membrane protein YphA (DoxX/SURF4 family)
MNAILGFGKYLYAIPFAVFGIFHFMNADAMAGFTPGGAPVVYLVGVCLIAACVSILLGKYDKLATTLLAVMLLLFVVLLHGPGAGNADPAMSQQSISSLLKDLALAGAAMMYAAHLARDKSVIG